MIYLNFYFLISLFFNYKAYFENVKLYLIELYFINEK